MSFLTKEMTIVGMSHVADSTTEVTEITERGNDSALTGKIIGVAIEVHRALGPGLLESAYEACLIYVKSMSGCLRNKAFL